MSVTSTQRVWGKLVFGKQFSNYQHIKRDFSAKQTTDEDNGTSLSDSCLLSFPLVSLQGESQRRLYRELLRNYNRLERPVMNDSQPLVVELQLSLLQIIDVVSHWLLRSPWHPFSITNLISHVGTTHFLLIRLSEMKVYCLWLSTLKKLLEYMLLHFKRVNIILESQSSLIQHELQHYAVFPFVLDRENNSVLNRKDN